MEINFVDVGAERKKIDAYKAVRVKQWKAEIAAKGMTVAVFCRTAKISRALLDSWVKGFTMPTDANFEKVESTLKSLEEGK